MGFAAESRLKEYMTKFRAAVIGLGQAGSRFDEENRGACWSHVGAYLELNNDFELVAGIDPAEDNRKKFELRCPGIAVLDNLDLLQEFKPDVVSIATPHHVRLSVFESLLSTTSKPKLIICEKPLSSDASERKKIVELCEKNGVHLLIHYNRRYYKIYQKLFYEIKNGKLGKLTSVTIRCANRWISIGSHALDLLFYVASELPEKWTAFEIPALFERGEPAFDFVCQFPSGFPGRISTQGFAHQGIFEVDVVGELGRMTVTENGRWLDFTPLEPSKTLKGYLVPGETKRIYESELVESSFLSVVTEASKILTGQCESPTLTGRMAMYSENILSEVLSMVSQKK